MNGRYAVLYGKLSPKEQQGVLSKMAELIEEEFGKRNLLGRFGRMFCHSDIINYGNLHDIDFQRTQTLCQGGQKCDFCFVRHRKGEVWKRTESI